MYHFDWRKEPSTEKGTRKMFFFDSHVPDLFRQICNWKAHAFTYALNPRAFFRLACTRHVYKKCYRFFCYIMLCYVLEGRAFSSHFLYIFLKHGGTRAHTLTLIIPPSLSENVSHVHSHSNRQQLLIIPIILSLFFAVIHTEKNIFFSSSTSFLQREKKWKGFSLFFVRCLSVYHHRCVCVSFKKNNWLHCLLSHVWRLNKVWQVHKKMRTTTQNRVITCSHHSFCISWFERIIEKLVATAVVVWMWRWSYLIFFTRKNWVIWIMWHFLSSRKKKVFFKEKN